MFDINVVAPEFKGLNTVKQHRIINEVKFDGSFQEKTIITSMEIQCYKLFCLMNAYRYLKKKLKICMVFEYVRVFRNRKFCYRRLCCYVSFTRTIFNTNF